MALLKASPVRSHLTFGYAVAEGMQDGVVVSDGAASAIGAGKSGFWLALGQANAGLVDDLPEPPPNSLLLATTPAWAAALGPSCRPRYTRLGFEVVGPAPEPPPLMDGLSVVPFTAEVATRLAPGLDPWVIEIWGGPDEFVRRSFGTVVVDGDGCPVAMCCACAIGGGEAEVEVGTAPEWRGGRGGGGGPRPPPPAGAPGGARRGR